MLILSLLAVHHVGAQIPIQCNDPDCNLVCFGNFESFTPGINNVYSVYYDQLGIDEFVVDIASQPMNTVDIYTDVDDNTQILFWGRINQGVVEMIRLPLSAPIQPGCTVSIQFRATAESFIYMNQPNPFISVWGLDGAPCQVIEEPLCGTTPIQLCNNPIVQAHQIACITLPDDQGIILPTGSAQASGLDFVTYNLPPYTNNTGAPITDLILYGEASNSTQNGYRYYMDDIVVTSSCRPEVPFSITPTVQQQCNDGQAIIEFEICIEGVQNGPAIPIELNAGIPLIPGVGIVAGGGFDQNGFANIILTPDPGGMPVCTTLTLTLNIDESVAAGTQLDVLMNIFSSDACLILSPNNTGDVVLQVEDCCKCEDQSTTYVVGNDPNSVVYLSQSGIPIDNDLVDACIEVNGRLIWDVDLWVRSSHFVMNEGSTIEIYGGYFMGLDNNLIEGCERMWQGITVNLSSQLQAINNNTIRDAQYAVKALDGSFIYLDGNTFDKNYVGLFVPPSVNGQAQIIYEYMFENNNFTCTEPLKQSFSGQIPLPGPKTHAGVVLNNTTGFSVGSYNLFSGIANGLIADRSTFSVMFSTFENQVDNQNGDIDYYGVYAEDCAQADVTNCTFTNVANGIYASNCNIKALDNNITTFSTPIVGHPNVAIRYFNGAYRNIRIQQNVILAAESGISVNNCLKTNGLRIKGNVVDLFPSASATSLNRTAIALNNCRTGWLRSNTVNNTFPGNNFGGISLYLCRNLIIDFNALNDQYLGFSVNACYGNYFLENEIISDGYSGNFASTGVNVFDAADRYCKNKTGQQTDAGFYFQGECIPTPLPCLTCNTIGSAFSGLVMWADFQDLSIGTRIGEHGNKGNNWNGAYVGAGAVNQTDDQDLIFESKFVAPLNLTPVWETGQGVGQGNWFQPLTNETPINCLFQCPVIIDPVDDQIPFPEDPSTAILDSLVEGDIRTATGAINGSGLSWMAQQRLYERLKKDSTLLSQNADVASFYADASASAIGDLYLLQQNIFNQAIRDSATQSSVKLMQDSLLALIDTIHDVRSTGTGQNQSSWELQLKLLANRLAVIMDDYYLLEDSISTLRQAESYGLLADNAEVDTTHKCAANEIRFNYLYLENQLWSITNPSSQTEGAIKVIADQCPKEGGFAVYMARSVYRAWHPEVNWNDKIDCSGAEQRTEKAGVLQHGFQVWPNPANQTLLISTNVELHEAAEFELFDSSGKLLKSISINPGMTHAVLNTGDINDGLFIFRIHTSEGQLQAGKLIIQH